MADRVPPVPPLRLALCITELHVGGAESCLVQLATRLDRRRFLPAVISLASPPPPDQAHLVHRLVAAGITPQFLHIDRAGQFCQAVRRLRACLDEFQAELLQTFLFHADIVGARAAGRRRNLRHVAGLRVADPRSRWRHYAHRYLTRSTSRYVCVSQDVAHFAARHIGLPDDKLTVIPNGVDVANYASATPISTSPWGIPEGRKVLLYVGRLDRQKRPDRLVAVIQQLKDRQPACDLIIVGSGPLRGGLEAEVSDAGLTDRVHFAGWQPEVARYLAAADILLMTSSWEGMPNVVLEAMAAGKPVVSCDCEGVRELLGDGGRAQIVPWQDHDPAGLRAAEFAARIQEIADDDRLAAGLGQANQQRARRQFSVEKMVDAYQQLYLALRPPPDQG